MDPTTGEVKQIPALIKPQKIAIFRNTMDVGYSKEFCKKNNNYISNLKLQNKNSTSIQYNISMLSPIDIKFQFCKTTTISPNFNRT